MSTGVQIVVHNIDYTEDEEYSSYIDSVYVRFYNLLVRSFVMEEDYIDDIMYIISSTMEFLDNDNTNIVYKTIDHFEDFSCVICADEDRPTVIAKLSCGHVFHRDCIVEWGKYKKECPLCRTPIETD